MVFVISFCGFCKTWSFAVSGFYNTRTCYYFDYIQKLQRLLWNVIFFFQNLPYLPLDPKTCGYV